MILLADNIKKMLELVIVAGIPLILLFILIKLLQLGEWLQELWNRYYQREQNFARAVQCLLRHFFDANFEDDRRRD